MNSKEHQEILNRLEELSKQVLAKSLSPEQTYYDNVDIMKILKVSKRTLMQWRTDGVISFSQIAGKIYYSLADVNQMMQKHYKKSFS